MKKRWKGGLALRSTTAAVVLLFCLLVVPLDAAPRKLYAKEQEECGKDSLCLVGSVCRHSKCFTPHGFPVATRHHQGVGVGGGVPMIPAASRVGTKTRPHGRPSSNRSISTGGGKEVKTTMKPLRRRDLLPLHLGWLATSPVGSAQAERARRQLNGDSSGTPTCSVLGCGSDAWSFECSCDELCATVYFDCCSDYAEVCATTTMAPETTTSTTSTTTTTPFAAGSGFFSGAQQQQSSSTPVRANPPFLYIFFELPAISRHCPPTSVSF